MKKTKGRSVTRANDFISDIREMIVAARERVAVSVNAELTMLYWNVGRRINQELLGNKRAEYGKQIIDRLSARLCAEFGDGWKRRQLFYCVQFSSAFPDWEIVHTLCAQLSWSHIKSLLELDDPLKREFYAEMCKIEHWSVRTLRGRIDAMMYERTAIAKKPGHVIRKDLAALRKEQKMSPDLAFRDPYFLDFLGLHGAYSEKELEKAMVADMKQSLIELGGDMAFVAEQKRVSVDNEDYYIDLLFSIGDSAVLWPSISRLIRSRRSTGVRWNFTCAGLTGTKNARARSRRLGSSSARAKTTSMSNSSSLTRATSVSRPI